MNKNLRLVLLLLLALLCSLLLSVAGAAPHSNTTTSDVGFLVLKRSEWQLTGEPPRLHFCLSRNSSLECNEQLSAQQYLERRFPNQGIRFTRFEHQCLPEHSSGGAFCTTTVVLYYTLPGGQ